jgi:aminopeptidase N
MPIKRFFSFFFLVIITVIGNAQPFNLNDTLRGSNTPERSWWEVKKYTLTIEPNSATHELSGTNKLLFQVVGTPTKMQLDLQVGMKIDSLIFENETLNFTHSNNVWWIEFPATLQLKENYEVSIFFSGTPREAVSPPWDGGWIWKTDNTGNPWVAVACQGLGASSWFPCKDYQGDEPDLGVQVTVIVPKGLHAISNGKLKDQLNVGKKTHYVWEVKNPINSYNITVYIGKYKNWKENFSGENGPLQLNYWALTEEYEKAYNQFKQVPNVLKVFEKWFGPYPFYDDSYKLVQAPYLGMEHQSAIAYGNQFKNGYLGQDLSETGTGLKWDFIIVHETGHEWFGNNITSQDIADMWIHEAFTSYSEVLFVEETQNKAAALSYLSGIRKRILNDRPIIGEYNVHNQGSGDMYYKGSNLIHILRQLIGDDDKFRAMLRAMNQEFYHQIVTSEEIENFIQLYTNTNLFLIFEQYLRTKDVPTLEYTVKGSTIYYKWTNCLPHFDMPIRLENGDWIYPSTQLKPLEKGYADLSVSPDFYINIHRNK